LERFGHPLPCVSPQWRRLTVLVPCTTGALEPTKKDLLNQFLKEHRKVTELETTVVQQRKDFEATVAQQQKDFQATAARQQKQIEALTTGLQKVSAQLEVGKPAPQTVLNNQ
jgi:hypothetical protein